MRKPASPLLLAPQILTCIAVFESEYYFKYGNVFFGFALCYQICNLINECPNQKSMLKEQQFVQWLFLEQGRP